MEVTTTNNIRISVISSYEEEYSNPEQQIFIFSYRIKIENLGEEIVQLMKRHWYITDSNGIKREVVGDGVIGKQPILYPDDFHEYQSACDLNTDFGSMKGQYLMRNLKTNEHFSVDIPEFKMTAPQKLN